MSDGFLVPKNVAQKVRVELTLGNPYRFLSLLRVVSINAVRRGLVALPKYLPASVHA